MNNELSGTVKALLDEYKKAIDELIAVVKPLSSNEIMLIRDDRTTDTNCRSIQTILTHVIYAGEGYITYIENHAGFKKERPPKIFFENVDPYIEELNRMFEYSENFFVNNPSIQTEETDNSKKISASWGQQYDIEQLVEHAIVHVLKHRRQIQNFIRQPKEKLA
jgi:uncharacterized damage-inducible protein DinB